MQVTRGCGSLTSPAGGKGTAVNKSRTSNATGTGAWTSLFSMSLSTKAASLVERLVYLQELATDPNAQVRVLVAPLLSGCGAILATSESEQGATSFG
jgi:uncharacterized protein YceK